MDTALLTPGAHQALLPCERTLLTFHPPTEPTLGAPTGRAGARCREGKTRRVRGQWTAGNPAEPVTLRQGSRLCVPTKRLDGTIHVRPPSPLNHLQARPHSYPQIGLELTESGPTQGCDLSICRREKAQMDSGSGTAHGRTGRCHAQGLHGPSHRVHQCYCPVSVCGAGA